MAEAVSYALADKLGRIEAHRLVQELSHQAAKEKRHLKELLLGNLRVKSLMSSAEVEKLFIPLTYQGSAQVFIDRLVMSSSTRQARRVEPRVDFKAETKSENWQDIRMVEPRLPSAPQLRSLLETEAPRVEPRVEMPPAPSVLASSTSMASPPVPPPDLDQTASPVEQQPAVTHAVPDLSVTPADRIEPPAGHVADPVPKPAPPPPPADDDAPGAFMDVLSRADAEAEAAAHPDGKKPS
jgi:3-carboxy-cis,cis-muconate cycloisomerase